MRGRRGAAGSRALLVAATLAAGCAPSRSAPASATAGYVTAGYSALWPTHTISVCWNDLGAGSDDERALVRDVVASQYGQDGLGFTFTGWDACTPDSRGVRIAVRDEVPHVTAYGAWLDGQPEGVILDFDFNTAGVASCRSAPSQSDEKSDCIRSYALHEFGHVLGLRHEANRPDGQCPAEDQTGGLGEAGAFPVDAYDAASIMNYCELDADLAAGTPSVLSAGDVATITQYYGRALTFPTADLGAQCATGSGSWDSVDNCCALDAAWTPGAAVGYRTCSLPAAAIQQQACAFANGQWDNAGACCASASPLPQLTRWNTFYQRCL